MTDILKELDKIGEEIEQATADKNQAMGAKANIVSSITKNYGIETAKEIEDKLKNSIPVIKRNWNKMRQQIKKFEQDMIECIADQESHVRAIFGLLGLIY